MYYQPEAMLEQYDIEIKQITKGRGVFCCETDQGKKVLAPFRGSAERAKFVREILCSMQEKGYPVEQVSLTKDGQCVVTDESGMRFWLKDLVEGNECQTGREKDVAAGAQALAGFHCCVSSCVTEIPDFMKNTKNEEKPETSLSGHSGNSIRIISHRRKKRSGCCRSEKTRGEPGGFVMGIVTSIICFVQHRGSGS